MYTLNQKWVVGTIKIRNMFEEMKEIDRKNLLAFLKEEKEKEENPIQKQDYDILIASIMGIESLIIENERIQVIFNKEARWRGECEAEITKNETMIRKLKEFYKKLRKSISLKVLGIPG